MLEALSLAEGAPRVPSGPRREVPLEPVAAAGRFLPTLKTQEREGGVPEEVAEKWAEAPARAPVADAAGPQAETLACPLDWVNILSAPTTPLNSVPEKLLQAADTVDGKAPLTTGQPPITALQYMKPLAVLRLREETAVGATSPVETPDPSHSLGRLAKHH